MFKSSESIASFKKCPAKYAIVIFNVLCCVVCTFFLLSMDTKMGNQIQKFFSIPAPHHQILYMNDSVWPQWFQKFGTFWFSHKTDGIVLQNTNYLDSNFNHQIANRIEKYVQCSAKVSGAAVASCAICLPSAFPVIWRKKKLTKFKIK